jgi:hypothetical protein
MAFAELRLGDQTIRYDRDATQCVYAGLEQGNAEKCGCIDCQNFAAQRDSVYPESFKRLLDQLGIDLSKEGEVYAMGPNEAGKISYGGWFYFAGELIEAGENNTNLDGFQFWFNAKGPKAPAFWGEPVLSVEFVTALDWVISARRDPGSTR